MKSTLVLSAVFVLFNSITAFSQAGTLDPSFAGLGYKYTAFSGKDEAYDLAIQTDGKIVTVGRSVNTSNLSDVAIARFLPNGALDNTFGNAGKVIITDTRVDQHVESVAIQPNGKIVATGRYKSLSTVQGSNIYYFMTIRLNSNGTLDNTFNGTGKILTTFNLSNCFAHSIALQTDGKIVVGGQNYNGAYYDFALARYNSNGTLDNTFGISGKKTFSVSTKDDYCNEIAIQPNGRIVAAGITAKAAGGYRAVAVVRFLSTGSPDNSFGSNGIVITEANDDAGGLSVALQTDNKIVVSGHSMNDNDLQGYFVVARYNADGSADVTFNGGSAVLTPVQYYDRGESVAIQNDGRIVVAGMVENYNGFEFNSCVLRYLPNGSLDNSFGSAGTGIVIKNFGGTELSAQDWLNGVALQNDGKIVTAGLVQTTFGNPFYFLNARYFATGAAIATIPGIQPQTVVIKETTVSVYPNPATDFIIVRGLNATTENKLVVTNLQGNVLKQVTLANSSTYIMHLETLPRGTFVLLITAAGKTTSIKFIKD
jgi:uncharacterized delta-60 repeat protein